MADLNREAQYVIVTGGLYGGHTLVASHAVSIVDEPARPGEFTEEQAQHLLDAGKIQLASDLRPTPVERPEDAVVRLSDLEPMGDDKFLLRAPWLPEAETITGEEAARARLAEVQALGLEVYRSAEAAAAKTESPANAAAVAAATITGNDGFAIEETGSNGYYTVSGPNREPEKVRGKAAAEARLAELRAEAA